MKGMEIKKTSKTCSDMRILTAKMQKSHFLSTVIKSLISGTLMKYV